MSGGCGATSASISKLLVCQTNLALVAPSSTQAANIVAAFKTKGFDPQGYTLYSYAAMQIFKQAAEKAKSLDSKKMAEVMHSGMPFHTVIGDIAYDSKGDRTTVDYVWYVWKKGADGKINFEQM